MLTTPAGELGRRRSPPYTSPEVGPSMDVAPARSRTTRSLHNFTSIPRFNVTWGRRKQLRCVKDSDHYYYLGSPSSPPANRRKSRDDYEGDGIELVREKLMLDLRTEVDQMKASIFRINHGNGENRPWNLRTRRAVCKNPNFNDGGGSGDRKGKFSAEIKSPSRKGCCCGGGGERKGNLSAEIKFLSRKGCCCGVGGDRKGNLSAEIKSPPRKGCGGGGSGGEVEDNGAKLRARSKFSVSLSKQEIEEDFLSILGNRPARRPKKRPKYVQKQIDVLFPGYWLSEVTPDMYKVIETHDLAPKGSLVTSCALT